MFDQRSYESNGMFYLRWTARILSLAVVSLLFFFFIGEGFDISKVGLNELIGLLFFPLGLVVGLLISWKNEGLGAVISVSSLFAFYFVYGLLINGRIWQGWAFLVFAVPSFLFLIYWLLLPRKFADFRHV
ncbi:MAG TPA: hypothetical protein PKY82_18600 [Pyrinomonadaceae bacterium]|nr:hypothetical protein [Pyrinomonadaceae bacterium]